jgi:hypothetical protein
VSIGSWFKLVEQRRDWLYDRFFILEYGDIVMLSLITCDLRVVQSSSLLSTAQRIACTAHNC